MPIDYAALAKQAGATSSTPPPGKVDYAALAKQAGATSSTPTADAPVAGAGDYGVPQPAAHSAVDMQPSLLGKDAGPKGTVANLLTGAVKSIPGTMAGIGKYATIGKTPDQAEPIYAPLQEAAQTNGTAQAIGKGVGNAAQFLIPGAAEEELGLYGASKLPMLGEYAAPVAKLGSQALGAGSVNAAQGGSFGGGAAAGAAGGLFSAGVKAAAPMLAETALGVRATDRAFNRTPGQAILAETKGINPGDIAKQATEKVGELNNNLVSSAQASPLKASLLPARQIVDNAYNQALLENEDATIKGVGKLQNQLHKWSGAPGAGNVSHIPQDVSPEQLLSLKRGVGSFRSSFNPATTPDFVDSTAGRAYHALDSELDRTVPGAAEINQRMSTLLPVAKRAGAADLNAGIAQRALGRFMRPTGALMGAGLGYEEGQKEGRGLVGGLTGAGLGLFAPEVITSPSTLMGAARAASSPFVQKGLVPLATGAALQAAPKKKTLYGN